MSVTATSTPSILVPEIKPMQRSEGGRCRDTAQIDLGRGLLWCAYCRGLYTGNKAQIGISLASA